MIGLGVAAWNMAISTSVVYMDKDLDLPTTIISCFIRLFLPHTHIKFITPHTCMHKGQSSDILDDFKSSSNFLVN